MNPAENLCNINNAVRDLNIAMRDCGKHDNLEISLLCATIRSECAEIKAWALRNENAKA
jgi:hypothetical protein